MRAFWRNQNDGDAQMIGVVVALLVSIAVGLLIWYKLNAAVFSSVIVPGKNMAAMNATYLTVNTTANTIWTLFPIVAIVIVAGIILAIVMNFGRGEGQ